MRTGRVLKVSITVLVLVVLCFQIVPMQQARADQWYTLFNETFEGNWYANWGRADADSRSGLDYWGDSTYRAYSGYYSAWCAAIGSKTTTTTTTIFSEGFESSTWMNSWLRADTNPSSGIDYWGRTSYRRYSGTYSAWCAAVGTQSGTSTSLLAVHRYDNNMQASLYRSVNLAGYTSASLSYRYWINSETNLDYLQVVYRIGSTWYYADKKTGLQSSFGWRSSAVSIPVSANSVGFYFRSDSSVKYEGAYVDSIVLTGTRTTTVANSATHTYDDYMYSSMYRSVNLDGYDNAFLDFKYWLSSESGYDYLKVLWLDSSGAWQQLWQEVPSGNSYGWKSGNTMVPTTARAIAFLFASDSSIHNYEGAYIDDVVLQGFVQS